MKNIVISDLNICIGIPKSYEVNPTIIITLFFLIYLIHTIYTVNEQYIENDEKILLRKFMNSLTSFNRIVISCTPSWNSCGMLSLLNPNQYGSQRFHSAWLWNGKVSLLKMIKISHKYIHCVLTWIHWCQLKYNLFQIFYFVCLLSMLTFLCQHGFTFYVRKC